MAQAKTPFFGNHQDGFGDESFLKKRDTAIPTEGSGIQKIPQNSGIMIAAFDEHENEPENYIYPEGLMTSVGPDFK